MVIVDPLLKRRLQIYSWDTSGGQNREFISSAGSSQNDSGPTFADCISLALGLIFLASIPGRTNAQAHCIHHGWQSSLCSEA